MALPSWASTVTGAEVRFQDHPTTRPNNTPALSVDQLAPASPTSSGTGALTVGWLSPAGYYCVPEALGQTSSDASWGRPCRHATSVTLAANLIRTLAVAIPGTVPDGEGVLTFLPLQYGTHRTWVHTVDAEVILHLLRHADPERTTGVPAGAARAVNQMPLQWIQNSLRVRRQHAEQVFWFARTNSNHSNTLLHKAHFAASQDTSLQYTPPGPGQAELIIAGSDGLLDLRVRHHADAWGGSSAGTTPPRIDALRTHTPGHGPCHSVCPRPGPHC